VFALSGRDKPIPRTQKDDFLTFLNFVLYYKQKGGDDGKNNGRGGGRRGRHLLLGRDLGADRGVTNASVGNPGSHCSRVPRRRNPGVPRPLAGLVGKGTETNLSPLCF